MNVLEKIIENLIKGRVETSADLAKIKRRAAKEYKVPCPSNIELLKAEHRKIKEQKSKIKYRKLEELLRKRKVRSLSGVAVVTVLTKPYKCPGRCVFCPEEKFFPKSYLPGEPAAQRAKNLNYEPYLQVKKRLESLKLEGHFTDKIELIILGGTWSYYPKKYQENFVKWCFGAANEFDSLKNPKSETLNPKQTPNPKFQTLKNAQRKNERAKCRIVGLTVETRPDLVDEKETIWLRYLGVTKVELGAQIINDKILEFNQRGHGVKEIISATKILKDAGFKVCYHLMLNLPGSSPKKDFSSFKKVFASSDFRPDWLKIYPCVVCKGSKLYQLWKQGKYKPYSDKQLIEILVKIKSQILPYFVRVGRLFRDIPVPRIEAGCKISNLREVVSEEMKKRELKCKCIRCREIRGEYHPSPRATKDKAIQKLKLFREDYDASDGREMFLSFEDKNRERIYSFLRMRIPSQIFNGGKPGNRTISAGNRHFIPILQGAAIIRELHTYGQLHPLETKNERSQSPLISPQHKGLGKKLMKEAEKIVCTEFNRGLKKEFGNSHVPIRVAEARTKRGLRRAIRISKIAVISGIGARHYYQKLNYKLKNTYMLKLL
ncbi:MAG: tRNA uridine(34) 5-carboxymethylaminomethyl modification radical SAM/GNAT enzyme Elp3 [Parcubacteria group bacterium CG11_big_fil_rev_8_21_14_0_20_39_14]|nr:MAG: tRNA uridine(34) 5-carboxymethylaminomethyl modification radical SAM/GNAT enzyme Elp3 [Parcubacteria group bacterium CG11_big_fil_rev_8_21_14_0_20_39_14]